MITGETLRLLRTLKGIKQANLARELGISQQAYSKLEKCKNINEDKVNNLLMIMECGTEELEELQRILLK
jgi:transcriptional regulator with XRE-family HTH domain